MADFYRRWDRAGRTPTTFQFDPSLFENWGRELAELAGIHGTSEFSLRDDAMSLSSDPAHDPSREAITEVETAVDRARVRSVLQRHGRDHTYYEYQLTRTDEDWRITHLLGFFDPPGTPLIDPAEAESLLAATSPDAPLRSIEENLQLDIPSLFTEGREVTPFGDPVPLHVVRLGEITCGSGVLTVADFGWIKDNHAPLIHRVPAGTYPVEVSEAGGTNVALRLLLSEAPPVSWHPAERTNGTHVVGVDAGNVAIVDFGSLATCEARQVETLYQQGVVDTTEGHGSVFSLTDATPDAVAVHSGKGDGAYPCYWGVAADGALTQLVIDFAVLIEQDELTVTVPWVPGRVEAEELIDCELEVGHDDGTYTITHNGDVDNFRVLAPDKTLLIDGHRLGLRVTNGSHSQTWEPEPLPPPGSTMEVIVTRGYRHI